MVMSDKPRVHIRDHIESFGDPYIDLEHLRDNTICKHCGALYVSGRWYVKGLVPKGISHAPEHVTLCPACRKLRDRVPGGVLKISGDFIWSHRDEILNLIRNTSNDALSDNPLERVMSMETEGDDILISTTNVKLVQKIGRALHRAYHGDLEYKWSQDNKLARVYWSRED